MTGEMEVQKLQMRGINRRDIVRYLEEMGGTQLKGQVTETAGHTLVGHGWTCFVAQETYFTWFQSQIPKVDVVFQAENADVMQTVLQKFRLKTLRAGG